MNEQLTEIMVVLDRSGSMRDDNKDEAAIEGFNGFMKAQAQEPGDAHVSLCLFDHETILSYEFMPIENVPLLDSESYVPRGSTALLDAIGAMVDHLGYELEMMPEPQRPGKVIFVILTDGLENASKLYTLDAIKQKIQHQTDVYKWEFVFLSSNLDSLQMAAHVGIKPENSAFYENTRVGTQSSYVTTNNMVSRIRSA